MVEQDKFIDTVLTALTINEGVRLQFGPDSATARQVHSLAVWEDVSPREIVMVAIEKLFEVMVSSIREYHNEQHTGT